VDLARYVVLGLAAIGTLVLVALTMRRPGTRILSMPANGWLFLAAFLVFVAIDVVTGHKLTGVPQPWMGAVAILLFLTVVLVDLVVLVRRTRSRS
jgi:hypothetical protein